jgi:polyphosphate kinase
MKNANYDKELHKLQTELCHLQNWVKAKGLRVVVLFEGRDGAGKGGTIRALTERVSPRVFRVVALPAPSDREKTQVYMQRYLSHFPAAGEVVIFDRSWYNRAGVERVMGFCTQAEYRRFLEQAPVFERMLVDDGILLHKYWLSVDQVQQEERFAERALDPMKRWKLSQVDLKARERYVEYGRARDAMFKATHTKHAPWHAVDFNDQRRGRLNLIRHLLDHTPDLTVPVEPLTLPRLSHKPAKEKFRGRVKPIRNRY